MSQILDAINRAEKARQRYIETGQTDEATNKSGLYHHLLIDQQLKQNYKKRQLIAFGGLGLGLACLGIIYYQGMFDLSSRRVPVAMTTAESISPDKSQKLQRSSAVSLPKEKGKLKAQSMTDNGDGETVLAVVGEKQQSHKETQNQQILTQSLEKKEKPEELLLTLTPIFPIKSIDNQGDTTGLLSELKPIKVPATTKGVSVPTKTIARHKNRDNHKKPAEAVTKSNTSAKQRSSPKKLSAASRGITITALVYDQQPKSRFILVKGATIREGEKIPNTPMKIVQILTKGVIVDDGQGEVLIRVH